MHYKNRTSYDEEKWRGDATLAIKTLPNMGISAWEVYLIICSSLELAAIFYKAMATAGDSK